MLNNIFKRNILSALAGFMLVFTIVGCEEESAELGNIESEPLAFVGYALKEIDVLENGDPSEILSIASKNLFVDAMFDIVILEGDTSALYFTDAKEEDSSKSILIEKNSSKGALQVSVADDSKYNGDYKVKIGLKMVSGEGVKASEYDITSRGNELYKELVLNIREDDPAPPFIGFSLEKSTMGEADGEAHTVTIALSKPAPYTGSFDFAIAGTAIKDKDYSIDLDAGTVDVAAGDELFEIKVTPKDNSVAEKFKTIEMSISNLSEGFVATDFSNHTLTVEDNDLPEVIKTSVQDGTIRAGKFVDVVQAGGVGEYFFLATGLDPWDPADRLNYHGMVRFDLSDVDLSRVLSAKLYMAANRNWTVAETNAGSGTPTPITHHLHYVSDDTWDETTITWNNAPSYDTEPFLSKHFGLLGDSPIGDDIIKHEFDITDQVREESDGIISIRIALEEYTKGQRLGYGTRDLANEERQPTLVIVSDL